MFVVVVWNGVKITLNKAGEARPGFPSGGNDVAANLGGRGRG